MNIQGKIHAIFDVQQVTQSFKKREFVVEYADNPMYPQYILFQLVQDRVELISNYQAGDMIDVTFNLRGRQWQAPDGETKYFNSLEAWRLNPVQEQQPMAQPQTMANQPPAQQSNPSTPAAPQAVDVTQMDDDDDLPF